MAGGAVANEQLVVCADMQTAVMVYTTFTQIH